MKKSVLLIALILSCSILQAQNPHSIDTIMGREPTYYYQCWFDSAAFHLDTRKCQIILGSSNTTMEIAKYNYTNSTLKVIGIAVGASSAYIPDPPSPYFPQCADTTFDNWYEKLILYKPTDTGMVVLDSGRYTILDTSRWMKLFSHQVGWNTFTTTVRYIPIFEVHFDRPITVTDSFYVASTNYHGVVDSQTMTYPGPPAFTCYYSPYNSSNSTSCYPQRFKYRGYWTNYDWAYEYSDLVWMIFPIIDTTQPVPEVCQPPRDLHIKWQDSTSVRLAWDPGDHNRSWIVSYGPASRDPESYPSFASTSPEYTLRYLTPGADYAARVRAVCFDNNTYSDWSDTIRFTRNGSPIGIPSVNNSDNGILLLPNPARTEVTIHSENPLKEVAIFDIHGHIVLEQKAHSHDTNIDIRSLANGSYVVRVTTSSGSYTLKLTVE